MSPTILDILKRLTTIISRSLKKISGRIFNPLIMNMPKSERVVYRQGSPGALETEMEITKTFRAFVKDSKITIDADDESERRVCI